MQTTVPLLRNFGQSCKMSVFILFSSREFSGIFILGIVKEKLHIDAEKMVTVTQRPSR